MTIYEHTDASATEMERLFWALVPGVAERAGVATADAVRHMQRAWADKIKSMRVHHGIDYRDDGRAALWRVRLIIWRCDANGAPDDRLADTDPNAPFNALDIGPGETLLYGLPAVADWALELITACHAPAVPNGITAAILAGKLKSLRVALSNSGGRSVWRLRYAIAASDARITHHIAYVYVQREESPRHKQLLTRYHNATNDSALTQRTRGDHHD